jgi:hypothetical protein
VKNRVSQIDAKSDKIDRRFSQIDSKFRLEDAAVRKPQKVKNLPIRFAGERDRGAVRYSDTWRRR